MDSRNLTRSHFQYLELRFDKAVRNVQTLVYIVTVLLLLPVTLYIPAMVFAEGNEMLQFL